MEWAWFVDGAKGLQRGNVVGSNFHVEKLVSQIGCETYHTKSRGFCKISHTQLHRDVRRGSNF